MFPDQNDEEPLIGAEKEDRNDRLNFIRKVYGILSCQLTLTAVCIGAVKTIPGWNSGIQALFPLVMVALIIGIFVEIAIICCSSVARRVPTNYIMLLIFTLCQAFVFSFICSMYTASSVICAAGMTAGVTIALTLYALFTKTDFTMYGGAITVICCAMLLLAITSIFMSFVSWWHPVVSCILVIFYGFFLIYDTQLVAGGGKYSISLDDYIVGALIIYVDIMGMFLELLKLFGDRN